MSDFVISISYGNYLIQNGGTDKVIREHRDLFAEYGVDYIFLFPVARTIKIGKLSKTIRYWGINRNTDFIGLFKLDGVLGYIGEQAKLGNQCRAIFVHHTWRVQVNDLRTILEYIKVPIYFYLHDFHSICDGKNMINQDGNYCGYGLNHFICSSSCVYHTASQKNIENLRTLVDSFNDRLIFIAPSDNTRDIYRNTFIEHKDKFVTIPHQKLNGEYKRNPLGSPIKVAFIGKQVSLKGWDDYKALVSSMSSSGDYDFYYLGTGTDTPDNVKATEVSVREQGPDAMMNALRSLGIDVVLLLSRWPETYSYTYFEAYAAGCFVVTYACSGNMADMVKQNHNGIVIDNKDQLMALLHDSNSLTKCMTDFFKKYPRFPLALKVNDEIVRVILRSEIHIGIYDTQEFRTKRQLLAETLYRRQNRSALNKLRKC